MNVQAAVVSERHPPTSFPDDGDMSANPSRTSPTVVSDQQIPMIRLKTYLQPDPPYYLGNRIIDELGPLLKLYSFDRVYLVTNQFLLDSHGEDLLRVFRRNAIAHTVVTIEASETTKTFATLEDLCETLVDRNISKSSIVVGFGGGCLTNIVGLAAGMIFRGLRYVEMPTTLMAVTDSSLSNKQAVNGRHGKNQFGIYYAPLFIFGDTHYLASEPASGRRAALAEGVKNGFISDPALVKYFALKLDEDLEAYTEKDLYELAYKIIQSKLKILERDPSEKHYAMTLEYGHTFGHAMEFLTHGAISHGYAVSIGMCIAAELSHLLGFIPKNVVDLHYQLFGSCLGIDLSMPAGIDIDDMIRVMKSDNKKTGRGTKFVLLKRIGECLDPDGDYQVSVEAGVVKSVLRYYKAKTDKKSLVSIGA
jgi:3-dehydroquinate synthetase